jgi:hypothetical protein
MTMRKKSKLPPTVAAHIHKDEDVTLDRVAAFGGANHETHMRVLTELRRHASDDTSGIELSLLTLLFAFFALIFAPKAIAFDELPPIAAGAVVFVVVLILVAAVSPIAIPQLIRHNRRVRAQVWLGAYQDEIARRHGLTGRKARRWKSAH